MTETVITKALGSVEMTDTTEPNGSFEVILSASTLDRQGEIVEGKAFEPLPDHIPFDIDHGRSVVTTVGSGVPFYAEDGTLHVKGTFASTPLAQEVRTLVSEGHIRTTSVAFIGADRSTDEKGVSHVKTAELLNGTFTPVPANRESVVLSSKAFAAAIDDKAGARNSTKDQAAIQSTHDAMVGLGASCDGKSHTTDETKDSPADEAEDTKTAEVEAQAADTAADVAAEAATETAKSTDDDAEMTRKAMRSVAENAAQLNAF